jgi:uncharacterized lipoprotein YbaY
MLLGTIDKSSSKPFLVYLEDHRTSQNYSMLGLTTMSSSDAQLVKGEILFPKELGSFSGATVNVYLEDVSLLDAPAKIVAKQVIANLNHSMGTENRVEFVLQCKKIADIRASYSIRVHVAFRSDEQIHRGDYISTESYPVLTFGDPNRVSVRVTEVN